MSLLLIFSILPLRKTFYELFLYLHRSLALIALICLFYHLKESGDTYEPFLWPCVAIWAFDYAVRWARLLVLNYKVAAGRHIHALISYDRDYDVIQSTVFPSFHLAPKPGTFYFLYFPTLFRSFGAHPFTISGWTAPQDHSEPMPVDVGSEEKATGHLKPAATHNIRSTSNASSESLDGTVGLQFLIRPQQGLTASLRDHIIKGPSKETQMPVLLEGPYGTTHPLETYDTVLFIAGGTGISPVLGYLQSMLTRPRNRLAGQKIHVAWTAKKASFFSFTLENGLRAARADENTRIDLFLTGGEPFDGQLSELEDHNVRIQRGRPLPSELVESVVKKDEARPETGSIAVFVCGPGALADDTRRAVCRVLGSGGSLQLDYFEEQFGW